MRGHWQSHVFVDSIETPLDLAFAVGKLAHFSEIPNPMRPIGVRQVLRYVNGSCDVGICFHGLIDLIFVDAVTLTPLDISETRNE